MVAALEFGQAVENPPKLIRSQRHQPLIEHLVVIQLGRIERPKSAARWSFDGGRKVARGVDEQAGTPVEEAVYFHQRPRVQVFTGSVVLHRLVVTGGLSSLVVFGPSLHQPTPFLRTLACACPAMDDTPDPQCCWRSPRQSQDCAGNCPASPDVEPASAE